MVCRRYIVEGSVQGVLFRASTQQTARRLGLTGWVRNLPAGSVELIACGNDMKLKELEQWLWRGPRNAVVERVSGNDVEPRIYPGFSIVA